MLSITEEMLGIQPMKDTSLPGEDIFQEMKHLM
jgi:hypothetical protein